MWKPDLETNSKWYREQTDARLKCLMRGSWDANDREGFAMARAEMDRRSKGGTFAENLKDWWFSEPLTTGKDWLNGKA